MRARNELNRIRTELIGADAAVVIELNENRTERMVETRTELNILN